MSDEICFDRLETPVGVVGVLAGPSGVQATGWRLEGRPASSEIAQQAIAQQAIAQAIAQLREYFAGARERFDLPLALPPLEDTTYRVLRTLADSVPYGTTITYGGLAARSETGVPARAIGSIMAANPLPIIIPCHRVVASGGLGGYSGGEPGRALDTKRWLLEHEGALPPRLV